MSNREARSFLEAICANPDDNTTRLVYADWLDEQGDPTSTARAEFIRVQVERAALQDWDARCVRLLARSRALLAQHVRAWRSELPTVRGVTWGDFRRGFVTTATFDTFAAIGAGGAAFRAAPLEAASVRWPRARDMSESIDPIPNLRELSITGRVIDANDVARLADAPVLSTLRALNVREAALGPDGFRRLATSPHLKNLTALRVPHNSIGNGGIDVVVGNTLPALTELDLSEPGGYGRYAEDPVININGMTVLAAWPGLARLRSLSLSGSDLQQNGLRAILQSPFATGLKHLAVRGSAPTGTAMREFGTARPGLELESLDVGENVLQGIGARHLAGAPCLRQLKVLHIDNCELRSAPFGRLTKAPFFGGLRILHAGNNTFGTKGLTALLAAKPAELHTLGAGGNNLGNAGAAALASSPASDTLLEVNLYWNGLGDKAVQTLAAATHLRNLLILRLGSNQIGKKAAADLTTSAFGKRLAVLELSPMYDEPIPF